MPEFSGRNQRSGTEDNDEHSGQQTPTNKQNFFRKVRQESMDSEDVTQGGITPRAGRREERLSESLETQLLSEIQSTESSIRPVLPSEGADIEVKHEERPSSKPELSVKRAESKTTEASTMLPDADKKRLPMQRLLSLARKDFRSFTVSEHESLPSHLPSSDVLAPPRMEFAVEETGELPKTPKKTLRASIAPDTKFSDSSSATDKKFQFFDDAAASIPSSKKSFISDDDSTEKCLRFDAEPRKSPRPVSEEMRLEYGRAPTACERYSRVEDYAKILVDDIAEEAISKGRDRKELTNIQMFDGIEYHAGSVSSWSDTSIGTYVCVLEWPTIEEFTVELGNHKIAEFVSYWSLKEDWKCCINFLYGQSDAACDFYRYEVIFSIPCKQYPIPQATASVYFTFEASRIRPKTCLVDVYYVFETQRLVHKPSSIFTFQEDRLFNIVDAKIKFYKTLTF